MQTIFETFNSKTEKRYTKVIRVTGEVSATRKLDIHIQILNTIVCNRNCPGLERTVRFLTRASNLQFY